MSMARTIVLHMIDLYYRVKPLIPRRLQLLLRRIRISSILKRERNRWPILEEAGEAPVGWQGWPDGKKFALVLTHDVESSRGVALCDRVASIEEEYGFRSAFCFVPERYSTPPEVRENLVQRGFEVFVHGLNHDGKLFRSKEIFDYRCDRINQYLAEWETRGFASPAAHHNFAWISNFNIDWSICSYDYDPFEPQGGGVGRIFPFWVSDTDHPDCGYVELPYTLAQDFTLLTLMGNSIELWCKKLDWIAERGGMALLKVHPDYMYFDESDKTRESYPAGLYRDFLGHVKSKYADVCWSALPGQVASFWKSHPAPKSHEENRIKPTLCHCSSCEFLQEKGYLTHFAPSTASTRA